MSQRDRLLARMRQSKGGWKQKDLSRLYRAFGFEAEEGKKHTLYSHPKYPTLIATVTRSSGVLPTGYVEHAVKLIDELTRREGNP